MDTIELPDAVEEGVMGSISRWMTRCISSSRIMKLVALVSSSISSSEAPASMASHHAGGLGGAAAGVLGGEMDSVLSVGQVVDKHGDVGVPDAPPVLGTDLDRCAVGDDILPPIPGDVVVHPQLQGLEQGGLPVVAAAHDQSDPLWGCPCR